MSRGEAEPVTQEPKKIGEGSEPEDELDLDQYADKRNEKEFRKYWR